MNPKDYRSLKDKLNKIKFVKMKEYKMGDALSIPIVEINTNKKHNIFRMMLTLFSMSLTLTYCNRLISIGKSDKQDIIFYISHMYSARKDYMDAANVVKELFPNRIEMIGGQVGNWINRKITLSGLKNLWLIPIWLYQIKNIPYSLYVRLSIVMNIFEARKWLIYVQKTINTKDYCTLITFFDARIYDNILVQYFKLHKIPTATLQHGHFNATMKEVDDKYQIGIAFEGFVSDIFLAWGEYTKNEAIKNGIDAQHIVCVGCPKYIGYRHKVTKGPADVFGVVLDGGGKYSEAANIAMLHIANTVARLKGMRYVIKPHPVSDISVFDSYIRKDFLERIAEKSESVEAYADSVSFSIVMGSSVYSELLYMKANVFRYISAQGIDRYEQIKWGSFRTIEELLELYDLLGKKSEYMAEMNQITSDMLCEPGDIGQNYRRVIEEMGRGNSNI